MSEFIAFQTKTITNKNNKNNKYTNIPIGLMLPTEICRILRNRECDASTKIEDCAFVEAPSAS
jgi:hypothetical protein